MSLSRPRYNVALTIFNINIALNTLATILTFILILYMRNNGTLKMNLYLNCVLWLTLGQFLYESATPLTSEVCSPLSDNPTCTSIDFGFLALGGCGASLWSFLMICAVIFTVETRRHPAAREWNIMVIIFNCALIAFAIPLAKAAYYAHENATTLAGLTVWLHAYDYIRLTFVGLSFLFLIRLYYSMQRFTKPNSEHRRALFHLIRKIMWYPLLQCISRIAGSAYTIVYGQLIYNYPEDAGDMQTFLLYIVVLIMPLAGIGNFIVFLRMTPDSVSELGRLFSCLPCCSRFALVQNHQMNKKSEHIDAINKKSTNIGAATLHLDPEAEKASMAGDWHRMSDLDEEALAQLYIQTETEDMEPHSESVEMNSMPNRFHGVQRGGVQGNKNPLFDNIPVS